jgi:predicted ATP-binding protein involved in virulence
MRISISKTKGLVAKTSDENDLDLSSLSSGEQHELVMLYDLLFHVKPNTLVLLDEPELSLHITWQKAFLEDLLKVVSETTFDVLIATHSPFIVGERYDLITPLEN